MNQEQIAEKLKAISQDKVYKGGLSTYAVQSIRSGRSNYPVSNLITYCQDLGLKFVMIDLTTEDRFFPVSILGVHKVLNLLMDRYEVDNKLIYRKTAVHYTAPKSLVEEELEKIKSVSGSSKYVTPLSIKTLLAVCEVIHCDLSFDN